MSEEQIEYLVERATDRLDEKFLRGDLTQQQYDDEMNRLAKWADEQHARRY